MFISLPPQYIAPPDSALFESKVQDSKVTFECLEKSPPPPSVPTELCENSVFLKILLLSFPSLDIRLVTLVLFYWTDVNAVGICPL